MTDITVNGTVHHLDGDPETPLLWYLRDQLGLLGTRFGCGAALCGCCTVHVNDVATCSCTTRIRDVEGKHVTTIEGLSANGLHPLQEAWIEIEVPQCGYCQSGQLCRRLRFFPCFRTRQMKKSIRRCREISAAAGPIHAFVQR